MEEMKALVLGEPITLEDFVSVARFGRKVEFSPEYAARVDRSRTLVERWVEEERVMYGVTTGFGALCTKAIDKESTAQLQENIILSHSVSVGEPLSIERVRGIMLMVLQNIGQGYSGVRMCVLERYRDFLNAAKSAYIVGAMSLEAMKGVINAFDPRVMAVRPHPDQLNVSENVRRMLKGSGIMEKYRGSRVQDALSLRCIPQLHGAARKTLEDAKKTVEIEMNSCCDNPIIWPEKGNEDVISACNADSAYVGMEMDSACIAAVGLAKMSERRNNRIVDGSLSGYPYFCIKNPGLNSGLMIPQYVQAGLLNEMRMLATPSTIDNTPTCGNQEDYVAMGYNACKKSGPMAEKLEYMLAIELLSVYEVQQFVDPDVARAPATAAVLAEVGKTVPVMEKDVFLHPYIEYLKDFIHSGGLIRVAEQVTGALS